MPIRIEVQKEAGKYPVLSPRFEKAEPFSDGLALVKGGDQFGYIDHNGVYAIQPQFDGGESFTEGLAVVGTQDSGFIYVDHSGRQAIETRFALASPFFKGRAHVKLLSNDRRVGPFDPGKFAYIDSSGRIVFSYKH